MSDRCPASHVAPLVGYVLAAARMQRADNVCARERLELVPREHADIHAGIVRSKMLRERHYEALPAVNLARLVGQRVCASMDHIHAAPHVDEHARCLRPVAHGADGQYHHRCDALSKLRARQICVLVLRRGHLAATRHGGLRERIEGE
eukprot:7265393-Prymnesium_polylepis.1